MTEHVLQEAICRAHLISIKMETSELSILHETEEEANKQKIAKKNKSNDLTVIGIISLKFGSKSSEKDFDRFLFKSKSSSPRK